MMVFASIDNPETTPNLFSIKLFIDDTILNSYLSFKVMIIVTCKTLVSNQCPQDWFNTQVILKKEHRQCFKICAKLKVKEHD
jgi:hypothetical protein